MKSALFLFALLAALTRADVQRFMDDATACAQTQPDTEDWALISRYHTACMAQKGWHNDPQQGWKR